MDQDPTTFLSDHLRGLFGDDAESGTCVRLYANDRPGDRVTVTFIGDHTPVGVGTLGSGMEYGVLHHRSLGDRKMFSVYRPHIKSGEVRVAEFQDVAKYMLGKGQYMVDGREDMWVAREVLGLLGRCSSELPPSAMRRLAGGVLRAALDRLPGR